jgi:predicted dehydrogenase
VNTQPTIRFGVIGINHGHIYLQVNALLGAGSEFVSFYAPEPELAAPFAQAFPQAKQVSSPNAVLDDSSIQLIVTAGIPSQRAPLGIQAMKRGKDFMTDKPGFTTLEQLAEARRVQAETGRIYSVYYCERFADRATTKAGELVHAGAVGCVIQTAGFGPHRLAAHSRPEWFFQHAHFGGILNDLVSHQMDQFLYFTSSRSAEVVASHVGNLNHPQYPELEDFGDILVCSDHATGYCRVDWLTPDSLATYGDARLLILGSEGYIELRKTIDIAGRPGADHLFLVDNKGIQYIDCSAVPLPYGHTLVHDVLNRTETTMTQRHCFLASELALVGQTQARWIGVQPMHLTQHTAGY